MLSFKLNFTFFLLSLDGELAMSCFPSLISSLESTLCIFKSLILLLRGSGRSFIPITLFLSKSNASIRSFPFTWLIRSTCVYRLFTMHSISIFNPSAVITDFIFSISSVTICLVM
eukprot:NODE_218_length_14160_cov_0.274874.p6 type:complete len:115 gc:universal NODE_218_length_14160_cov_0.274874:3890-3546(-)